MQSHKNSSVLIKMQIFHLHHWNNTSAGELPVENIEQPNFICIEQQTVHSKRKSDSQNQILRLHNFFEIGRAHV